MNRIIDTHDVNKHGANCEFSTSDACPKELRVIVIANKCPAPRKTNTACITVSNVILDEIIKGSLTFTTVCD